jgi:hypothetical protein
MSKRKFINDSQQKKQKKSKSEDIKEKKVEYFKEPIPCYTCDYVNGLKHGQELKYINGQELGELVLSNSCDWRFGKKHGDEHIQYNNTWVTLSHICQWENGKKHNLEYGYLPVKNEDFKMRFYYSCNWENGEKHNGTSCNSLIDYNETGFQYTSSYKNGDLVEERLFDKNKVLIFSADKKDKLITFSYYNKSNNLTKTYNFKSNSNTIKEIRKLLNIVTLDDFTDEQIWDQEFNIVDKLTLN